MNNRLKEVREAQGLSQRELSTESQYSQSLISDLERGQRVLWDAVRARLARVLGVSELTNRTDR